jgi:signal transduction histidine kinase
MELKQDLRVVEERERIARDLHDTVIQELFATSMTIHSVANQTIDAAHVSRLETAVENLDETISEIRSVVFGLHRDSPASVGIRARIVRIADDEHAALGFEPRIRFDGPVDALNERIAMELIAAAREALTNVARHAQASKVEIAVECNDHVTLRVVDDGRGVTTSAARGNGIRNLTDRAATLGGTCHLSSRPDGGTEFVWRVPACV